MNTEEIREKRIYIAGPMRDLPGYQELFYAMEEILSYYTLKIYNPCVSPDGLTYEQYMCIDKAALNLCELIIMLPGWESSQGAREEYTFAQEHKITVIDSFEIIEAIVKENNAMRIAENARIKDSLRKFN